MTACVRRDNAAAAEKEAASASWLDIYFPLYRFVAGPLFFYLGIFGETASPPAAESGSGPAARASSIALGSSDSSSESRSDTTPT